MLVSGESLGRVEAGDWLWIALLAVVPGGAHLAMNWAHRYVDASVSSVIGSSNPIVAAGAAVVILGQPVTIVQVACGLARDRGDHGCRRAPPPTGASPCWSSERRGHGLSVDFRPWASWQRGAPSRSRQLQPIAGSSRHRHATTPVRVLAASETAHRLERPDRLATEEPMAIQVRGRHQEPVSVAVTMRTPGNDFELAAGFLVSEGLLHDRDELAGIRYCDVAPEMQHYNVVTVDLTVPFTAEFAERHFFASSSCGICGKASLDQVEVSCPVDHARPGGRPLGHRLAARRR